MRHRDYDAGSGRAADSGTGACRTRSATRRRTRGHRTPRLGGIVAGGGCRRARDNARDRVRPAPSRPATACPTTGGGTMSNSNDKVLTIVRAADPLDADDVRAWTSSERCKWLACEIVAGPVETSRDGNRRRSRLVAIAAATLVATAGAAAAAATMLGGPAPDPVRAHLAELDRGMPPDLRYNPDLADARAVAATASGALYAADLPDGGYCIEAATSDGQPRGGTCVTAADSRTRAIEVIAPIPAGDDAPLLIGGHLNAANLTTLRATYAGTAPRRVGLGIDGYFLIQVPAPQRATALDRGVELSAVDSGSGQTVHVRVPPLRDDGRQLDEQQPIFVSTLSAGDDLTVVLGIEGRVNAADYATLDLTYPDGTVTEIPTRPGGSYRYDLPAKRRGDFARAFGVLTARNSDGNVIATAPVGSVAAWRARNH